MDMLGIFGFLFLIIGVALLGVGVIASQRIGDKMAQSFLGRYTQKTRGYLISGVLFLLLGIIFLYMRY